MRCNTPTYVGLRPQIPLRCLPSSLILNIMSLMAEFSRHYSPSIPNTIGLTLQGSITQQLLSTLWKSCTHCMSLVANPVIHTLINAIILASIRMLMSFTIAEDTKKRNHSKTLLVLLYIAHLLPLACMSEHILESIFSPEYTESGRRLRNFHVDFTLDEWNYDIIQPARDTVLDYYKVHMRPLSLPTVLTLKPIQPIFICFSALRRAIQCRRVHVCQQSILVSTCVWLSPLVDVLSFGQSLPYSYNHSLTSSIINSRRNLLWYHYLRIRGNFRSRRYTLQSEDACGLTQLSKEIHI